MKIKYCSLLWLSALLTISGNSAIAGTTTMVSVNAQQIVGNNNSNDASLSKGGTAVAFESDAENLALGDGNNARDIFLKSGAKIVSRVSINSLGQEARNSNFNWWDGNNFADSDNPSISSDGKLVVFQSNADNLDLLTQDTNNDTANGKQTDIFLRDVAKKKTYRLSGIMDGADGVVTVPALSDIFNNPLSKDDAPWKILTEANDASTNPAIAGTLKAGFVAFESKATNLIPSFATTAGKKNIYVIDLKTKKIELISALHDPSTGAPTAEAQNATPAVVDSTLPAISPDGRFVVFQSAAVNLVSGVSGTARTDVFLYDRVTFRMYQLSGALSAPSATGGFSVTAEGNNDSVNASLAGGGKGKSYLIAFDSKATNLDTITGGDSGTDSDVFVVEFQPGTSLIPNDPLSIGEIKSVKRISAPHDITGDITGESALDGDGTASSSTIPVIAGISTAYSVAFKSSADNLLFDSFGLFWNEDSNGVSDIYVYDSKTKLMSRANVDSGGEQGVVTADRPAIAPDGKAVGFDTADNYLVPFFGDNGKTQQVFMRKR